MALAQRSRAAMAKGVTLAVLGIYVLVASVWAVRHGSTPEAPVIGAIGLAALIAKGAVAMMLYRFRSGDANMRSVWICSRNDAIGNVAVVHAAAGVFGTVTAWPDLAVAVVIALLGITGGEQIMAHARRETVAAPAAGYRADIRC